MLESPEKRSFHRMELECPASFRLAGHSKTAGAVVKNLSSGGVLLWIEQEVAIGSELALEVVPHKPITPPLSARVEVLRSYPVEGGHFAAACAIKEILPQS